MFDEQIPDRADGGGRAFEQGMAVPRVADRGRQDVFQPHRAIVAQHQQKRVEAAGDAGRQQARARHEVEPQVTKNGPGSPRQARGPGRR